MSREVSHNGNKIPRLVIQSIGQFGVVGDQMGDIDIAIISFRKDIFANLIAVEKDVVEVEIEHEINQSLLCRFVAGNRSVFRVFAEETECICRLSVHDAMLLRGMMTGRWRWEMEMDEKRESRTKTHRHASRGRISGISGPPVKSESGTTRATWSRSLSHSMNIHVAT